MLMTKLKITLAVLLAVNLIGAGVGLVYCQTAETGQTGKETPVVVPTMDRAVVAAPQVTPKADGKDDGKKDSGTDPKVGSSGPPAKAEPTKQADAAEQEKRDAQQLRFFLPKMLESSDINMTHEALLIIRDDQIRGQRPSDELLAKVLSTLQRLLKTPKDSEGPTRRLACEVLGLSKSRKAILVLLDALADPYVQEYMSGEPGGHVSFGYNAVWREADEALRRSREQTPLGGR